MYENRRNRKAKRKNLLKRSLIIGTGAIAAAGGVAGAVALVRHLGAPQIPQAHETLYAYADYLQKGDYEAIYDLLDESSQTEITKEELINRYRNIYDGVDAEGIELSLDEPVPAEPLRLKETKRPVSIEYHISMHTIAGDLSFPSCNILSYSEEENTWKMIWDLEEIFPGLKAGYKVRVKSETAKRGQIYDSQFNLMAGAGEAWTAGIVPGKLEEPRQEAIENAAAAMNVSVEKVEKALSASWVKEDLFVPIRMFAKENEELTEQVLAVPGIMLSTTAVRSYPYKEAAGHLTGYVQNITAEELDLKKGEQYNAQSIIGKTGLEAGMESVIRSRDGYQILIVDGEGKEVEKILEQKPRDGEDVRLSINATLQNYIYEKMEGDRGAAVALNPVTGEVLAYVSTPSYDANDFVYGFTAGEWEEIQNDKNQPLFNRVKSTFCPGSVMKPVTAAFALEAGTLGIKDTITYTGNRWTLDESWGNYYVSTLHGEYEPKNLKNALIHSDNIFFAQAAVELGAERMAQGFERMGFDQTPEFNLALTASSYGGKEVLSDSMSLADSGYGHAKLMVNPLHLACMYSAFYNEGNMIAPTLLYGQEPVWWKENVMSPQTAETLLSDLKEVVNHPEGTGKAAKLADRILAGKTGTAELKLSKDDTAGTEIGWFVGMNGEKSENPIIIVMVIEDVKDRGSSAYVAKKVGECIDYYYKFRE